MLTLTIMGENQVGSANSGSRSLSLRIFPMETGLPTQRPSYPNRAATQPEQIRALRNER
jgi:hypothetical protein